MQKETYLVPHPQTRDERSASVMEWWGVGDGVGYAMRLVTRLTLALCQGLAELKAPSRQPQKLVHPAEPAELSVDTPFSPLRVACMLRSHKVSRFSRFSRFSRVWPSPEHLLMAYRVVVASACPLLPRCWESEKCLEWNSPQSGKKSVDK